jgi:hypothetical protein
MDSRIRFVPRASRVLCLLATLGASAATPSHAQQGEDRWFVTTIAGAPVGYYRETASAGPGTVGTRLENQLVFNRLGNRLEMTVIAEFGESEAGELRSASVDMKLSDQATLVHATAARDSLRIRSTAGGRTFERTVPTGGRVLGPEGIRILSRRALAEPGDRIVYRAFLGETGTVSEVTRTLLGRDTVHLRGAPVAARRVEERSTALPVATVLWLDAEGRLLRLAQNGPFGEMRITAADEGAARLAAGGGELPAESYAGTLVRTQVRLPRAREIDALTLELRLRDPSRNWPSLASPGQEVLEQSADRLVLRVTRPEPAGSQSIPIAPTAETRRYLAASAYVESDDPEIVALARGIVGDERDAWRASLRLQQWVAENMRFDLGIVMAPSRELLRDRRGTCVGYATLLTTLARAAGIPARLLMGYVYVDGMLGGHAWTEVLIDGRWLPLDAAVPAGGAADAARFAFVWTSLEEGAGALTGGGGTQLFGNLEARVLEYRIAGRAPSRTAELSKPYTVRGGRYDNPGLGMSVTPPDGFRFGEMDEVWPSPNVLTLYGPAGQTVRLQTRRRMPWIDGPERANTLAAEAVPGGRGGRLSVGGAAAVTAEKADRAAAAFLVGSDAFVLLAEGPGAPDALRRVAAAVRLDGADGTADAAGER